MQAPFHLPVTEDIELRLVEKSHAQDIFDLTEANRRHLREWLPWVDGTRTVADTSAFIAASARLFAANGSCQLGIWFQGRCCGMIGQHGIDGANRSLFIGYWLAASHQGPGDHDGVVPGIDQPRFWRA